MSKKVNKILPFLLGGGILYWMISSFAKQTIENVYKFTYKLGKIKFNNDLSKKEYYSSLYFDAEILINNPTNSQLTINSVFFEFFYDDKKIGTFNDNKPFVILPNTTTIKKILVQIPSVNVASGLISIIKTKSITINYSGLIKTSGVAIKYNDSIKVI